MPQDNRRSFRLSDDDMEKLAKIAQHYFGTSDKMQTAALKMLIEKEFKELSK
jgi:plasmid stabilization system protein ParE